MKGEIGLAVLATAVTGLLGTGDSVAADEALVLTVPSIWIYPSHNRNDKDKKWVPRTSFFVYGTVPDGSVFWISYTQPGGSKPWSTNDCQHQTSGGLYTTVNCAAIDEPQATGAVGVVQFKIGMKNEVQGKHLDLFSGRFKAGKHHVGNTHPDFKKQFGYYIDYDWALPIGYVYTSPYASNDHSYLMASFWFRSKYEDSDMNGGYVFYNGKEICKNDDVSEGSPNFSTKSAFTKSTHGYYRTNYHFYLCRFTNPNASGGSSEITFLDKNPGEYQIKVLRNGKLARLAKFTVGADGKIQSNYQADVPLGTIWQMVPTAISDDQDGKWDKTAYQKDAFYGHPLKGFAAP